MAKAMPDGLARLQSQSRISSNTWRKWCTLLELDPLDAVEVWEEICHPIMLATNKMPEIPYILQMRATRIEVDIFDFKEEVPQVLQTITFLYSLKDERLSKGKLRSAILKFYKRTALALPTDYPPGQFAQKFIFDLVTSTSTRTTPPSPARMPLEGLRPTNGERARCCPLTNTSRAHTVRLTTSASFTHPS